MKVWSRGLGKVELGFNLKEVAVKFEEDNFVIRGKTQPPVVWEFMIRIDASEPMLLAKLLMNKPGMKLFFRWLRYKLFDRKSLKKRFAEAIKTGTVAKPTVAVAKPVPPRKD